MEHPYSVLAPEYNSLLAQMRITNPAMVRAVATRLLHFKDRYTQVWAKTGVPVIELTALNERESGSDFRTYFGNGDSLTHPTIHVPKHRGPFPSWEAGCIDALHLDRLDLIASGGFGSENAGPHGWTWARACYEAEIFNGFGYRAHNVHSPYLWAGTNIYSHGKFTSDGHFDPNIGDKQLGCLPLMATLVELDPSLALIDAFPAAPLVPRLEHEMIPQPAPVPPGHGADDPAHDTKWIQASLNELDPDAELTVDGIWGRHTRRALMDFQAAHKLDVDGIAGPLTIAAMEEVLQEGVT